MSRIYSVVFEAVNISALQDLFEVDSATDSITKVHGWRLHQTTDVGDAAEEVLRLQTVRGIGAVTSGSGGTSATPQPQEDSDPAFGGTVEVNNTTRLAAGSGTLETLEAPGWNIRIPYDFFYPPELRPVLKPGEVWTLGLPAAPADVITASGELWLEEIG